MLCFLVTWNLSFILVESTLVSYHQKLLCNFFPVFQGIWNFSCVQFSCMTWCVISNPFAAPQQHYNKHSFSYMWVPSSFGYHKALDFFFGRKPGKMVIPLMMNICFTNIKFKPPALFSCIQ